MPPFRPAKKRIATSNEIGGNPKEKKERTSITSSTPSEVRLRPSFGRRTKAIMITCKEKEKASLRSKQKGGGSGGARSSSLNQADENDDARTQGDVPLSDTFTNAEIRGFCHLNRVVDKANASAADGDWIDTDSVQQFLNALEPEGKLSSLTHMDVDAYLAYVRHRGGRMEVTTPLTEVKGTPRHPVTKSRNSALVAILYDLTRRHFFCVLVDFGAGTDAKRPNVYVYDTLGNGAWKGDMVYRFIRELFPAWKDVVNKVAVHDRTHDVRQMDGSTCGPWSLWIIMVFVANVHGWRDKKPDPIFQTRYALTAYDVFGNRRPSRRTSLQRRFWKAIQGRLYADENADIRRLPD